MNNREFKFRVWDKDANTFLKLNQDGNELQPWILISCHGAVCYGDNQGAFVNSNQEKLVIQQFTGLVDSKGNEIFEGDILSINNPRLRKYFNGEVFWAKNYLQYLIKFWNYNHKEYWSDPLHLIKDHELDCKVIGNIFQHYDLVNNIL